LTEANALPGNQAVLNTSSEYLLKSPKTVASNFLSKENTLFSSATESFIISSLVFFINSDAAG